MSKLQFPLRISEVEQPVAGFVLKRVTVHRHCLLMTFSSWQIPVVLRAFHWNWLKSPKCGYCELPLFWVRDAKGILLKNLEQCLYKQKLTDNYRTVRTSYIFVVIMSNLSTARSTYVRNVITSYARTVKSSYEHTKMTSYLLNVRIFYTRAIINKNVL